MNNKIKKIEARDLKIYFEKKEKEAINKELLEYKRIMKLRQEKGEK